MRIPKRVRIIKNNEGNTHYDQFIGREVDVILHEGREYYLPLPEIGDSDSLEPVTIWWEDEVEVIEWEDASTLGVSDIDVGDGEIDFVYYCKICNGNVDGGDKYCRHCGKELVR